VLVLLFGEVTMSSLGVAFLAILALAGLFTVLLARMEGVGFLQPRSTRGVTASAGSFCRDRCRTADGLCPLTKSSEAAADCPLWKYVEADMPTGAYGSPFAA
jgi:hypothetical protein